MCAWACAAQLRKVEFIGVLGSNSFSVFIVDQQVKALAAAGAHFISTDFPSLPTYFGSNYQVSEGFAARQPTFCLGSVISLA